MPVPIWAALHRRPVSDGITVENPDYLGPYYLWRLLVDRRVQGQGSARRRSTSPGRRLPRWRPATRLDRVSEPGRIDRATAEAVLRRALERSTPDAVAEPEGLTPEQLVAIGSELGVGEDAIRAALGDVLGGAPAMRGGGLLGPRGVVARRSVPADADETAQRVAGWLDQADCLRLVGSAPGGRSVWEPRKGLLGELRSVERQLRGEPAELRRARQVQVGLQSLDDETTIVLLDAELGRERPLVGLGLGAGCAVVIAALASFTTLLLLVLAPLVIAGGLAIGVAAQRAEARRMGRAVERRLDAVARAAPPPTATGSMAAAARELARNATRLLRPPRPPEPPRPPRPPR